jgi:hypothetical protein
LLRFVKKLTVIGIIEYTHGVSNANSPPANAVINIHHSDRLAVKPVLLSTLFIEACTGWIKNLNGCSPDKYSSPFL